MKKFTGTLLGSVLVFAGSAVAAASLTLNCEFSSYIGAGNKRDVQEIVPVYSTHQIDGTVTVIDETGIGGLAEVGGSEIRLKYKDRMRVAGEVNIEYIYKRGSGQAYVKTRAVRQSPWDDFPERNGIFTIAGACYEG
jgi:hypothetical protein